MPQVDLSSVCGDRKVACETLAGAGEIDVEDSPAPAEEPPIPTPDYAPQSFWLSKDAELDWLDRNAFIERRDSGKGSNSNSTNLNPVHLNPVHVSAGSQRYSGNLKAKASMIGLPKPQKAHYADAKSRRNCRPASIRLFPKRSEPGCGKQAVALSEPSSPKVSCMGRVRSRKDRSRRGKNRKKQTEPELVKCKSIKERKTGFWKNFRFIFRSKGNKQSCKGEPEAEFVAVTKKRGFNPDTNCSGGGGGGSVLSEVGSVEPPGLGAVKRFASGRKSDGWAGDLEFDGAKSEPLDRGPIWRRREKGPPVHVEVDRDWQSVGPASV